MRTSTSSRPDDEKLKPAPKKRTKKSKVARPAGIARAPRQRPHQAPQRVCQPRLEPRRVRACALLATIADGHALGFPCGNFNPVCVLRTMTRVEAHLRSAASMLFSFLRRERSARSIGRPGQSSQRWTLANKVCLRRRPRWETVMSTFSLSPLALRVCPHSSTVKSRARRSPAVRICRRLSTLPSFPSSESVGERLWAVKPRRPRLNSPRSPPFCQQRSDGRSDLALRRRRARAWRRAPPPTTPAAAGR